jgi:hypothetical protein
MIRSTSRATCRQLASPPPPDTYQAAGPCELRTIERLRQTMFDREVKQSRQFSEVPAVEHAPVNVDDAVSTLAQDDPERLRANEARARRR